MQINKVYLGAFLLTNVAIFYVTPLMYRYPEMPYAYFALRAFALAWAAVLLLLLVREPVRSRRAAGGGGWLATGLVLLLLFYAAELVLTFYPETSGRNDTYCSKNWNYYYWRLNEQGFRDIDFETMTLNGKHSVVFAGDSYTEGHGIKDPKDRVSDRLRAALPEFNIYNIGKCGMDIREERLVIDDMPVDPKLLILQQCMNDWDYLLPQARAQRPGQYTVLYAEAGGQAIRDRSVLFNYLGSKLGNIAEKLLSMRLSDADAADLLRNFGIPPGQDPGLRDPMKLIPYCTGNSPLPADSISGRLFRVFARFNPSLEVVLDTVRYNRYLDEVAAVDSFCRAHDIRLLVVPYPNLDAFSMGFFNRHFSAWWCSLYAARGFRTLDIYPALERARLPVYTVNPSDNHINAEASRVVADTLLRYIRREGLLK